LRVLLVEDEQTLAKYLLHALKEHGYAVDAAHSGLEAVDWATAFPYDLILLDILLPGLDGLSVCRLLRDRDLRTPILILTARDEVADRVAGLDAGADDYLGKPFELQELFARIRALARRGTDGPRSPHLTLADLTLNPATREVARSGKAIDLTSKEFAVLECLLREPGRVLTREIIAEHVWSYAADNQSNVVDVYIRNLRRKIDDPYPLKLIQTVRGSGYRLSARGEDDPV
jgi:DNA-binding response OmpR family regulator